MTTAKKAPAKKTAARKRAKPKQGPKAGALASLMAQAAQVAESAASEPDSPLDDEAIRARAGELIGLVTPPAPEASATAGQADIATTDATVGRSDNVTTGVTRGQADNATPEGVAADDTATTDETAGQADTATSGATVEQRDSATTGVTVGATNDRSDNPGGAEPDPAPDGEPTVALDVSSLMAEWDADEAQDDATSAVPADESALDPEAVTGGETTGQRDTVTTRVTVDEPSDVATVGQVDTVTTPATTAPTDGPVSPGAPQADVVVAAPAEAVREPETAEVVAAPAPVAEEAAAPEPEPPVVAEPEVQPDTVTTAATRTVTEPVTVAATPQAAPAVSQRVSAPKPPTAPAASAPVAPRGLVEDFDEPSTPGGGASERTRVEYLVTSQDFAVTSYYANSSRLTIRVPTSIAIAVGEWSLALLRSGGTKIVKSRVYDAAIAEIPLDYEAQIALLSATPEWVMDTRENQSVGVQLRPTTLLHSQEVQEVLYGRKSGGVNLRRLQAAALYRMLTRLGVPVRPTS